MDKITTEVPKITQRAMDEQMQKKKRNLLLTSSISLLLAYALYKGAEIEKLNILGISFTKIKDLDILMALTTLLMVQFNDYATNIKSYVTKYSDQWGKKLQRGKKASNENWLKFEKWAGDLEKQQFIKLIFLDLILPFTLGFIAILILLQTIFIPPIALDRVFPFSSVSFSSVSFSSVSFSSVSFVYFFSYATFYPSFLSLMLICSLIWLCITTINETFALYNKYKPSSAEPQS